MDLEKIDVTSRQAEKFKKKGIETVEDLMQFLPRRYNDFSKETGILPPDQISCFVAHIEKFVSRTSVTLAYGYHKASGARLMLSFFHQQWIATKYSHVVDTDVYVAGKCTYSNEYNNYSMSPLLFEPDVSKGKSIYPIYSKIPNMSTEYHMAALQRAFHQIPRLPDPLPQEIVSEYNLIPQTQAVKKLHFPKSMEDVKEGQERFLFNDLLEYALQAEWAKRNTAFGSPFGIRSLRAYTGIKEELPYQLTDDQQNAIEDMIKTARKGRRISALVQGDVGCGKSIISFIMCALFSDSGYQSVLLAPTQVLARQHYEDLKRLLEPHGYRIALLDGTEMKASEKKALLKEIESGEIHIIVGTQAVLGKSVKYANLALAVIDEEHKFGVQQRKAILDKAQAGVHMITMSATPIPRSLATVLYGDSVQLITVKTLPKGRKPVITGISTGRDKIYRFIRKEASKGHQTYVVCPMIDDSDEMEGVASVEQTYKEYREALEPYGINVATLTGRNTKEETEDILAQFQTNEISVLISTTVVEVGVNVPTASLIVIEAADRFGLASLHQLRGRVGRSDIQSYCVLDSDAKTEDAQKRLNAMVMTRDGFEIAKADLEIRGAGDFLGTRQSGDNRILSLLLAYPDVYSNAKEAAKKIIDEGLTCQMFDSILEKEKTDSLSETYSHVWKDRTKAS